MSISLIVALSANGVIGVDGGLPWHLPEDLKRFKAITMGKPMIMGRATWESIGRPLPGRTSIVLTRQENYVAEGALVVNSVDAALAAASDVEEIMVIGGGEIYRLFLPIASRIYLTQVQLNVDGDTTFPHWDVNEWAVTEREVFERHENRPVGFTMDVLDRREDSPDSV